MKLYKVEKVMDQARRAVIELQKELTEAARYCSLDEDQRGLAKRCRGLNKLELELCEALASIKAERQARAERHGREIKPVREARLAAALQGTIDEVTKRP
jgi:hypothetical protein